MHHTIIYQAIKQVPTRGIKRGPGYVLADYASVAKSLGNRSRSVFVVANHLRPIGIALFFNIRGYPQVIHIVALAFPSFKNPNRNAAIV